MDAKVKDFRTGSLKGLKATVEPADYERLFPKCLAPKFCAIPD